MHGVLCSGLGCKPMALYKCTRLDSLQLLGWSKPKGSKLDLQLLLKVSIPQSDFPLDSMLQFSHSNYYYIMTTVNINGTMPVSLTSSTKYIYPISINWRKNSFIFYTLNKIDIYGKFISFGFSHHSKKHSPM